VKHERASEEVRQQAALYSLGLLTQHEAHCFERHMEECLVCKTELGKLMLAAAQIGLAVKEEEPPDGFHERFAARIDSLPRFDVLFKAPRDTPRGREAPMEKESETKSGGTPMKRPITVAKNTGGMGAAINTAASPRPRGKAAVVIHTIIYVILAAMIAFVFYERQSAENEKLRLYDRLESSYDDMSNLRRQFELKLDDTRGELEKFLELFRDPSVRTVRLKGQPSTPDNTGVVFWDLLSGNVTIIGAFAPAPPERVYQLCFFSPSDRTSVGLLPFDETGRISTVIKFDRPINAASYASAVVTLEAENNSSTRTAPAGQWSATGRID